MATVTRRNALAACAALALPVSPAAEPTLMDEDPRPVFVPYTSTPFPDDTVEALNARMLEDHEGRVWAYDHRANLPASYDEIDGLPENYRKAVLDALPVQTAMDLVLERLQRRANADPSLTDVQRAVIASAPLTLTAAWCEASLEEREAGWPDGGFWERARQVFTPEAWCRLVGSDRAGDVRDFARFGGLDVSVTSVGW